MASLNDLLRLLAETESRLTRETEAILAGEADGTVDPDRKSAVVDRLLESTPAAERDGVAWCATRRPPDLQRHS